MSDIVIRVENLGKRYRIGQRERYLTMRDMLARAASAPLRLFQARNSSSRNGDPTHIWALKDVSFEVQQGEVVGIIGRNGAGKTTLLKILARVTKPTSGFADVHGRMGSLLEVGTGFHPELTGRENVYLNGAILGMKKVEIDRKFDEIVAFAEVEKFIDTPVKHFSSGMHMRLAFAVAAHLEAEILLVDEVLAVGDARFQEKCLGMMEKTAVAGRTVFFVSHNMSAIQRLCQRVLLMENGTIAADGEPNRITGSYFSTAKNTGGRIALGDWADRITTKEARILSMEVSGDSDEDNSLVTFGGPLRITLEINFDTAVFDPSFGVLVHSASGEPILDIRSIHSGLRIGRTVGQLKVAVSLSDLRLYPGKYLLSPWVMDAACRTDIDYVRFCAYLTVRPAAGSHGDLRLDPQWGRYWVPSVWSLEEGAQPVR
jgi:lipopolysaccharide transport system ATP-binding protein